MTWNHDGGPFHFSNLESHISLKLNEDRQKKDRKNWKEEKRREEKRAKQGKGGREGGKKKIKLSLEQ